jgi:hypothetical protein
MTRCQPDEEGVLGAPCERGELLLDADDCEGFGADCAVNDDEILNEWRLE